MTVEDIIARGGGVVALASRLGLSHPTVSGWRRDGRIPAVRVRQVAEELRIPPQKLLAIAGPPPRRGA